MLLETMVILTLLCTIFQLATSRREDRRNEDTIQYVMGLIEQHESKHREFHKLDALSHIDEFRQMNQEDRKALHQSLGSSYELFVSDMLVHIDAVTMRDFVMEHYELIASEFHPDITDDFQWQTTLSSLVEHQLAIKIKHGHQQFYANFPHLAQYTLTGGFEESGQVSHESLKVMVSNLDGYFRNEYELRRDLQEAEDRFNAILSITEAALEGFNPKGIRL